MDEDDDDKRKESAIASVAKSLNPNNSKPSSSVAQARLSKFQELHKRRLQIKEKSKTKKKSKGKSSGLIRLDEKDSHDDKRASENTSKEAEERSKSISLNAHQESVSSVPHGSTDSSKKPQKLHWGLDTKERWERKSNM